MVYCIKSPSTEKVYYGSTFQPYLSNRLAGHRKDYKKYLAGKGGYVSSFEILQHPDHYIELVLDQTEVTKAELRRLEGV